MKKMELLKDMIDVMSSFMKFIMNAVCCGVAIACLAVLIMNDMFDELYDFLFKGLVFYFVFRIMYLLLDLIIFKMSDKEEILCTNAVENQSMDMLNRTTIFYDNFTSDEIEVILNFRDEMIKSSEKEKWIID